MTKRGRESGFQVSGADDNTQVEAELRREDGSTIRLPLLPGLSAVSFDGVVEYRALKRTDNGCMTCVEVVFNGSAHSRDRRDDPVGDKLD